MGSEPIFLLARRGSEGGSRKIASDPIFFGADPILAAIEKNGL
jgi:hypothetical protein